MDIFKEIADQEATQGTVDKIDFEFDKRKADLQRIEDTPGYKLIKGYCESMVELSIRRLKIADKDNFERIQAEISACESLLDHINISEG